MNELQNNTPSRASDAELIALVKNALGLKAEKPFVIPLIKSNGELIVDPNSGLTATDIFNGIKNNLESGNVYAIIPEAVGRTVYRAYSVYVDSSTEEEDDPAALAVFTLDVELYSSGIVNVPFFYIQANPFSDEVSVEVMDNEAIRFPAGGSVGDFLRKTASGVAWETVQIKTPRIAKAATDTTAAIQPNTLYVFPEMASLTITLAAPSDAGITNEYHFIFESGSTATTLTLPATVLKPDGFTVEANHRYEVSILENCMTAQGWAVSAS